MGTKTEIIESLKMASEYFPTMFEGTGEKTLTIIGGAAMVLQGCVGKVTYDIDVIDMLTENEEEYFQSFSINNQAAMVCVLPKGFDSRLTVSKYSGNILYYVPSLEDIVLTKLGRYDENDIQDFLHTDILERVNEGLLLELAAELAERSVSFRINWDLFQDRFMLCAA